MSHLIRTGPSGPFIAGALPDGAFRPAPALAANHSLEANNAGQGDTRSKIRPNVAQAQVPTVSLWQSGALLRLEDWLAPGRPAQTALGGIVLMPGENPMALSDHLHGLGLIAVEFPRFTDGRGLSSAMLLRQRLGWRGEIRAVGDVLVDQVQHMARCGFDSFALRGDQDPLVALASLQRFQAVYQHGADGRDFLLGRWMGQTGQERAAA